MSDESAAKAAENTTDEGGTHVPNIVRVHGKEFDVNDPTQKAQLSTWDEAHAKLVGRQTNELGSLRQFYKERQPSKDEASLLATAKAKAAEGDLDSAFDMIFSQAKESISQADKRNAAERQNSELWEEYFSERPELAKKLGRQRIKQVSATLDIFNENQDAFTALDAYWMPLLPSEKPAATKVADTEKPPVTLSGSGKKPSTTTAAKTSDKPQASIDDILGQHSVYFRK